MAKTCKEKQSSLLKGEEDRPQVFVLSESIATAIEAVRIALDYFAGKYNNRQWLGAEVVAEAIKRERLGRMRTVHIKIILDWKGPTGAGRGLRSCSEREALQTKCVLYNTNDIWSPKYVEIASRYGKPLRYKFINRWLDDKYPGDYYISQIEARL